MFDEIHVQFQTPYDVPISAVTISQGCPGQIINPRGTRPIRVDIEPGLLFTLHSNVMEISADVCIQGNRGFETRKQVPIGGTDFVIVKEAEVLERKQVFVSYKDEEDLALAELAKAMLRMAGFSAYLARDRLRVGASYWETKIYPAIQSSIGTLVLWTRNTEQSPDEVLRELRYSQEVGTPVGLFRGDEAELPQEYPADRKQHLSFRTCEPWVPFAEAIREAALREREGEPFFLE